MVSKDLYTPQNSAPSKSTSSGAPQEKSKEANRQYDAFISYSRDDKEFAAKMETALGNYKPPRMEGVSNRRLRIFRDQNDLIGADYYESINSSLSYSAKLVLICSPGAAASDYVNDEIERFVKVNDANNIIPVIIDGVPNNEIKPGQEDQKAFPPALCSALKMPLAIDYRGINVKNEKVNKGIYEGSFHAILAGLYNKNRSEIEQREKRKQRRQRNIILSIAAAVFISLSALTIYAFFQKTEAEHQKTLALEALAASERELLRAQGAELRAMMQRIDLLVAQGQPTADPQLIDRLKSEREEIKVKLDAVTKAHQEKLADQIEFRGDLGWLIKWEGHAGEVKWLGVGGIFIDPATDLGYSDRETISKRYAFLLTPDELEAVLSVVGLRHGKAEKAWKSKPILKRIRLEPFDVARLVPEVAKPFWLKLVEKYSVLLDDSTPASVHTALLSLAFNHGLGGPVWKSLIGPVREKDWLRVADLIESSADRYKGRAFHHGLLRRRRQEADLIRKDVMGKTRNPADGQHKAG